MQISSSFNIVLPKTRERGFPKTPFTDLLTHNLHIDASSETEWYKQERQETAIANCQRKKFKKIFSIFLANSYLLPFY